ncbi:DUF3465 domain-containing protein [Acinetobacter sp. ANC 5378]|uniref:DUF3465 domain-containing protein n=1 Tax=Acinetobacter sp. ANC 5378 TaxID=2731249 RepID=UPI00148F5A6F|nr:DUF3465 domain-containing protein [Acinetobacter sp. ANC 5378]NNG81530.1 DUF3465 domain-containing protein [Acinetobacter sp. ANC 5378]
MVNKTNVGVGAVIVVLIAAYFGMDLQEQQNPSTQSPTDLEPQTEILSKSEHQKAFVESKSANLSTQNDDEKIQQAFREQKSDIQVQSSGRVKAILPDDNKGSRHQKFILELVNRKTVLVAHNIDLSPRLDGLEKGEIVQFYGEYEYSQQGGVIHWTHHDPQKSHADGWLKYKGRTYQ